MENPSALLSYHIGYPGATGLIMIFSFYFVCVPVTGWKDRRPKENGPRGKGVSFPRGPFLCLSAQAAGLDHVLFHLLGVDPYVGEILQGEDRLIDQHPQAVGRFQPPQPGLP